VSENNEKVSCKYYYLKAGSSNISQGSVATHIGPVLIANLQFTAGHVSEGVSKICQIVLMCYGGKSGHFLNCPV